MQTDGSDEIRTQTKYEGPAIVHEYACSPCISKNGKYNEAKTYCPECDAYYCRHCLPDSCDHSSLGKNQKNKWGTPTSPKPGEMCNEHAENMIQLYCGGDNVVGCHVCMAEKHQVCTKLMYITTLVSNQDTRKHLQTMQQELRSMQSKILNIKKDGALQNKTLNTKDNELKNEMEEFHEKVIAMLDDLKKQSFDALNEMKKTISCQLEAVSQTCDRLQKDIASIEQKLQKSNIDETVAFIWVNQSNKCLEDGQKILLELKNANVSDLLSFQFHSEIEACLGSLKGLGKLKGQGQDNTRQVNVPFTVQKRNRFSVRDQSDTETCQIPGMCQLPDGSLVISNRANKCLKLIDSSYQVVSHFLLSSNPNSVCCTGDQEVAVALDNNTIQFVSVGTNMVTTRSIILKQKCTGMAYNDGKLYVTNFGSSVYVYSLAGTFQRELKFNDYLSSDGSRAYSRCISVSPDGNNIYVTNPNRNILLNNDVADKVVTTFSLQGFRCSNLCVDDVGNVFVCCNDSNSIVQIEARGGRKVADILLPTDGIKRPWTICFDTKNSRLLAACFDSDEVDVLDLIQK